VLVLGTYLQDRNNKRQEQRASEREHEQWLREKRWETASRMLGALTTFGHEVRRLQDVGSMVDAETWHRTIEPIHTYKGQLTMACTDEEQAEVDQVFDSLMKTMNNIITSRDQRERAPFEVQIRKDEDALDVVLKNLFKRTS
jgi:hypothetical protein